MSTPTVLDLVYARLADNVYSDNDERVRSAANTTSLPPGWQVLPPRQERQTTGFMAQAYKNGNAIVIAYAGTTYEGDNVLQVARDGERESGLMG